VTDNSCVVPGISVAPGELVSWYGLTAVARDPAGNAGAPRTVTFAISKTRAR
jgi:hypothetical protein